MNIVAIIPARGGSKGLPGKNIKLLGGIPLVARTILAAQQSKYISECYVTSDDGEIRDVATLWGAKVIDRPNILSCSKATSESAIEHAVGEISSSDTKPDVVVFLQCTSPFTTPDIIDALIEKLLNTDSKSVFSSSESHGFLWKLNTHKHAYGVNHNEQEPRVRRQDLDQEYRENGAVYAFYTEDFLRTKSRFIPPISTVISDMPAFEIDTALDWNICEKLLPLYDTAHTKNTFRNFKLLVMDFDGVHTDDKVIVREDGLESVVCSRADGMGIELLRKKTSLKMMILSKETNEVVKARAKKLKIDSIHGVDNKIKTLESWLTSNHYTWDDLIYIGNDINDVDVMKKSGFSFCPSDAHTKAKEAADYVLNNAGGAGALRELAEMYISDQENSETLTKI